MAKVRSRLLFSLSLGLSLVVGLGLAACLLTCKMHMPGESAPPSDEAPTTSEQATAERLEHTVRALAEEIGERNLAHPGSLERARDYLEAEVAGLGYEPRRLDYEVEGHAVSNLEFDLVGTARPEQIIIVGAHYDSVDGTPGADDNASGVAALLELAARFHGRPQAQTLRFVLWVNEEPPYFQSSAMGSLVHARQVAERGEEIRGVISLETLGYYRDEAGSQRYPAGVRAFYPDQGNFVGFVANRRSTRLLDRAIAAFRIHARVPSEGMAAPASLPGIGWSDQWSYWQMGWQGIMITDTAPFRNPNYHEASDTAETLDYHRLAQVVDGLEPMLESLGK